MMVVCATGTADRFHGFLRSILLNPHPGVYVSRDVDKGVRDRLWRILTDWHAADPRGMVVMIHADKNKPMGLAISSLGSPKREIVEIEGHYALLRSDQEKTLERSGLEKDA